MKHLDVVRSFFHRLEEGDVRGALRMTDRDLAVLTPAHMVLGPLEFEQVLFPLVHAFPDLHYELHDLSEESDVVSGRMDISGTHRRDLDVSLWGLPAVPASGRRVLLQNEPLEVALRYGKIRRVGSPLVGAQGILAPVRALGIELSPAGVMG